MQRHEFVQQLWLDYIHRHPDLGALRLWPTDAPIEYFSLLTLNQPPFAARQLLPALARLGFRPAWHHAMADRGLLATLLTPSDGGPWLILAELQLGTLSRQPREQLSELISHTHPQDAAGQNLLARGRPWPMPDWATYRALCHAHPLAGWLAVMGPSLHHVGYDCARLDHPLATLDAALAGAGLSGCADRHHGIFPVSPLLDYRFYATRSPRLAFADGDEHRIPLGGLALVQKCLNNAQERAIELLLPHHTRCEID